MKKLFTFAAALLASVAMMADYEPTAVYTVGDAATLGAQWKTGLNNTANYYAVGDTVIFSPYVLYQSAAAGWQEWTGCAGSGSTGTSWNAKGVFKGSTGWFTTSAKAATTRSTRQYFYNVTNCTAVQVLVKSGSSSVIQLAAYEIVAGVPSESAAKSETYNTGSDGVLEIKGLDANKTYRIVVNSNKDSNSSYYEIAFITVSKTIVSKTEVFYNALVNGENLLVDDVKALESAHSLTLSDAYVTAPEVTFTKMIQIVYDDESKKVSYEDIKVTAEVVDEAWEASTTINEIKYTVRAPKAASFTVTYKYGEETLGTEVVAAGASPAEYVKYETRPLATFQGWYSDAALTTPAVLPQPINADITFYAKYTKAYVSKNVNIEQLVLDNGTKYDIKSALTAAGWAYENIDALDTLNDIEKKDNRNYAFLGLKLKKKDAYVQCNLKTDGMLLVKFGNVGCNIKVTVKGANTDQEATLTKDILSAQDYEFPIYGYTEDVLVTFTIMDDKTVVLKQLMLDEIAEVVLPAPGAYLVTCKEAENGKVTATWTGKTDKTYRTLVGATVTLTVTPAEGYKIADVKVNGESLNAVEGVYAFEMPAKDVTVEATFSVATAIDNTEVEGKAVKAIENGQIVVIKNGVRYNVLGTEIR